ncbi:MAG: formylmethanofuran--tetrahydromethanopterin N-formyltransferase, partial [Pirellulaceae bacterium]
ASGVGGGNVILQAATKEAGLAAARRSVELLEGMEELITPFPGGVARSGSKVGSRYKGLPASTADAYCPTLRGRVESRLHEDAQVAYEVVIDGTSAEVVGEAVAQATRAAAGDDVLLIGAGNYGGKLGKHHFHLHPLLSETN